MKIFPNNSSKLMSFSISRKERDGFYWDKFAPSVPMSTYLVAYIVSDFGFKVSEPSQKNNVTFRIWAQKGSLDQVWFLFIINGINHPLIYFR